MTPRGAGIAASRPRSPASHRICTPSPHPKYTDPACVLRPGAHTSALPSAFACGR
ncbi:hypothetical protein HYPSUDRAFT_69538 [Hypholoma sublateritium FD-334 SS-4]|uniref:Uncharacterized protein n=1 Tax=Hypholoma sublateritium (strain FD-334 SS-4) TaxID=945553 RepID=A0A0D2NJF5_HYPSF|nr:hypothetical protein HYPSUDRAFT_69538 [Hypholoma sublateritium FD-334 SS-4]